MTPAERPLSPFLIYKPQLTSMLSFSHRATGVALGVGTLFLVWWGGVAAARTPPPSSWLGLLMLLGWTFSFFFHLCNGIRHLFWDAGYGFELRTTYASGWTVLAASGVLTVIAVAAGCLVRV
jgi:succinate dehydrogenase / fumarate reductase cytochrome b subunit